MSTKGFIPGEPLGICDRCGFKFRLKELRKEWTGLMVCKDDYDPRHPQDFVKGVKESGGVKDARPEPTDKFVGTVTADDL